MGPIDPIRGAQPPSRSPRWTDEAPDGAPAGEASGLPATIPPAPTPPPAARAAAAFAAQLIAGPERRGLRRGPSVHGDAKSAYLGTEWSGGADRRTRIGRNAKTEI